MSMDSSEKTDWEMCTVLGYRLSIRNHVLSVVPATLDSDWLKLDS